METLRLHELKQRVEGLISKTNYQTIVDFAADGETESLLAVSRLIALHMWLSTNNTHDAQHLGLLQKSVNDYALYVTEHDLLLDKPLELDEDLIQMAEILKTYREKLDQLFLIAVTLLSTYKIYHPGKLVKQFIAFLQLSKEVDLPDAVDEVVIINGVVYNKPLAAYVGVKLVELYDGLPKTSYSLSKDTEEYKTRVKKALALDGTKLFAKIKIEGNLDDLPFDYNVDQLRNFVLKSIPPLTLKIIDTIKFVDHKVIVNGVVAGGNFIRKFGKNGILQISKHTVHEHFNNEVKWGIDRKNNIVESKKMARDAMEERISHELGHAFESMLPVANMVAWQAVIFEDPVYVTSYVKTRYQSSYPRSPSEDFADSVKLFIHFPNRLNLLSPKRFEALRALYAEYMPHYADTLKQEQDLEIAKWKAHRVKMNQTDAQAKENTIKNLNLA